MQPTPPPTDPTSPTDPKPTEPPKAPEATQALTAGSIKLPDGFEVDQKVMGDFVSLMNDAALNPAERAQKLIDLQTEFAKAQAEQAVKTWKTLQETWQEEVRADAEIGGDKLEANLGRISTLLNTHGTPELRQVMDQTGAGNNVHVVKFLSKIAAAMGEALPAPAGVPSGGAKDLASRIFPTMK